MNQLRETCHCGHDKATHYADPIDGRRCTCLAQACDCTLYVNEFEPKPKRAPDRPTDPPPYDPDGFFT